MSIDLHHSPTLALFCCLSLLSAPTAAETPQTVKPEVADSKISDSKIAESEIASTPEAQQSLSISPEQQLEAQRSYERKSLYALHVNLPTLAQETDYLNDSWFAPQHGANGYTITNEEFYELLGNPELVEQYNANRSKKILSTTLVVSGTIGAIGSGMWIGLGALEDLFSSALGPSYPSSNNNAYLAIPLTVFVLSGAAILAGAIVRPDTVHPLKTNDAAKILDQYNNNLKQELGLPPDYTPTSTTP